ncbi:hypothetical protein C6497_02615 [Candidatus Poribacteria bacterium]|nr:MAG: hypothetical protein C6497_02615 [Candidatus Poribacteria bacterium]
MIWKVLIAPLLIIIFFCVISYLSKRDLENILIQKKQNSEDSCQKCNSSKISNTTIDHKSIEYIPVQDIDENNTTDVKSESNDTEK